MCISFLWRVQDHVDIIQHDEIKKDDENENDKKMYYKILNDIYSYRELSNEQMDEVYKMNHDKKNMIILAYSKILSSCIKNMKYSDMYKDSERSDERSVRFSL